MEAEVERDQVKNEIKRKEKEFEEEREKYTQEAELMKVWWDKRKRKGREGKGKRIEGEWEGKDK